MLLNSGLAQLLLLKRTPSRAAAVHPAQDTDCALASMAEAQLTLKLSIFLLLHRVLKLHSYRLHDVTSVTALLADTGRAGYLSACKIRQVAKSGRSG